MQITKKTIQIIMNSFLIINLINTLHITLHNKSFKQHLAYNYNTFIMPSLSNFKLHDKPLNINILQFISKL